MRMSPDLDFRVDHKDRGEEQQQMPMTLAQIERENHKLAKEEL